jgi:nucleoside 2-deoxyribosyltransferase
MNLLNKTKVYLIGPCQYKDGREWRIDAATWLDELGVTVLDPYEQPFLFCPSEAPDIHKVLKAQLKDGQFQEVAYHMKQIVRADLACVDRSDFLIVYIDPAVHTCGSYHELFLANSLKKPIFLVIEGGKEFCPLWLLGVFPHHYVYSSFEEVRNVLTGINYGDIVVDSKRWRLLKDCLR